MTTCSVTATIVSCQSLRHSPYLEVSTHALTRFTIFSEMNSKRVQRRRRNDDWNIIDKERRCEDEEGKKTDDDEIIIPWVLNSKGFFLPQVIVLRIMQYYNWSLRLIISTPITVTGGGLLPLTPEDLQHRDVTGERQLRRLGGVTLRAARAWDWMRNHESRL